MLLETRHCLCRYYLETWWEVSCPIPASSGSQVVIVSSGHKYSEGLLCRLVYASEEGRGRSFHSLIAQIIRWWNMWRKAMCQRARLPPGGGSFHLLYFALYTHAFQILTKHYPNCLKTCNQLFFFKI